MTKGIQAAGRDEEKFRSPTLKNIKPALQEAVRSSKYSYCPSAQWYGLQSSDGSVELECFCTQFRAEMHRKGKFIVITCDGYDDAIARSAAS